MISIYLYIFSFGLIIGSFLNALIWRLHSGESMLDRSRCPVCHQVIRWYDNVPVFSYLWLHGKCRTCKVSISLQYPVVELVAAILFFVAFKKNEVGLLNLDFNSAINLIRLWFVISVMVLVFVYDLRWYLILDKVTMPASITLFVFWLLERGQQVNSLQVKSTWLELFFSLLIGYCFFALQYYGSRGKWLGGGDVKLGVVMAFALVAPGKIVAAIFMAYILGAIVGVVLIAFGKKELGSKLPFGTFLAVTTVIVMFWGEIIINWYAKLAGF